MHTVRPRLIMEDAAPDGLLFSSENYDREPSRAMHAYG